MGERGTVQVELNFLSSQLREADWPLKVFRADATFVTTANSSRSFELDAGEYFVSLQLPGGQEFTQSFAVPLRDQTVQLGPASNGGASHSVSEVAQEVRNFIKSKSIAPPKREPSIPGLSSLRSLLDRFIPSRRQGRLRAIKGNLLGESCEFISTINFRPEELDQAIKLNVIVSAGGRAFLQLLQPKEVTLNIGFPFTPENPCFLYVTKIGWRYSLDVHFEDSTIDALLRYVQNGQVEWAKISVDSPRFSDEYFSQLKRQNPVGATVLLYALCRLQENERLTNLMQFAAETDSHLPDWTILYGEYLARNNRHLEALTQFITLRGLPFFTDGLKYVQKRLRTYVAETSQFSVKEPSEQELVDKLLKSAQELLTKLEQLGVYVDEAQPFLTFTGIDPLHPSTERLFGNLDHFPGYDLSRFSFAPSEELEISPDRRVRVNESVRRRQLTAQAFLGLTLAGMLFVSLVTLIRFGAYRASIAAFWCLALLSVGALLGFLFGIPRTVQTRVLRSSKGEAEAIEIKETTFQPNTNLEQISDWLTKILVGAALVNLFRFPSFIAQASSQIALALGGETLKSIAAAMLLYFPAEGFLGAFILTRMTLSTSMESERAKLVSRDPVIEKEKVLE